MIFFNMIFSFVGNTIHPLQVYTCDAASDDEIVTTVVGGGEAVVAAFNEMNSHDSHDINK